MIDDGVLLAKDLGVISQMTKLLSCKEEDIAEEEMAGTANYTDDTLRPPSGKKR